MSLTRFMALHLRAMVVNPRSFAALMIAVMLQLLYQLGSPLSYKFIFDEGIGQGRHDILALALGALAAMLTLQTIGTILQEAMIARLSVLLMNHLRGQLFAKLQSLSPQALSSRPDAELASLFGTDAATVETALVRALPSTLLQAGVMACSLILLAVISWQLFLVTMAALPLVYFLPKGFAGKAKTWQDSQSQDARRLLDMAQESITTSLVVRLFNLGETRRTRFHDQLATLRGSAVPAYRFAGLVGRTAFIGTGLSQLIVIGTGAVLAVNGHITAGYLVAFVGLLLRISDSVSQLATTIPLLIPAAAAQTRLQEFLDEPVPPLQASAARALPRLSGAIRFENVSFAYTSGQPILKSVSFTIQPGQRVALVGPSGCGKSTVLSLLMRLNRPESGQIYVDDVPIEEIAEASLREGVAVVPQTPILFEASLRENILAGRPDASQEEIEEAARASGVHEAILGKSQGYDTPVRATSGELSGGERQRVACARAFLRGSPIMLLDEATSALDPISEEVVNGSLSDLAGRCTILSVTHRLAGIADFDQILVFEKGELVESGRHEALLAQGGLYADLWTRQQGFNLAEADEGGPAITPERLALIPFLSECSPATLEQLSQLFFTVRVPQGRAVFNQGDPGDNFYILVRGSSEVLVRGEDGLERPVTTLRDGDFFGELALVRDKPRAATVMTKSDSWLLGLPRQHFLATLKVEPEVRRRVTLAVNAIVGADL